jgi:hypothetical protein
MVCERCGQLHAELFPAVILVSDDGKRGTPLCRRCAGHGEVFGVRHIPGARVANETAGTILLATLRRNPDELPSVEADPAKAATAVAALRATAPVSVRVGNRTQALGVGELLWIATWQEAHRIVERYELDALDPDSGEPIAPAAVAIRAGREKRIAEIHAELEELRA